MSKYILLNCPALFSTQDGEFKNDCCNKDGHSPCQDCTDCVIKQIVAECYEQENLMEGMGEQDVDFQYYYGRYVFAREILHLLDIQEVE